MPNAPSYDLHAALGYQLSLTARVIEKRFEDGLKGLGLTRLYWCILLACTQEGLQTPSEIAAFVSVDRTAVSRALRQMEDAGLIRRESGERDRRTTLVQATPRGADLLAQANRLARANSAHFLAKLGEGDKARLTALLDRLREGEETRLPNL
ncbi:Transcriptional regulator SlyA [Pseudoruegeria aquimaris]|uniref:Transcriptional regulator SlyA n=2 Tax=Pseudoruegeria aquimaris TaxID=393663 RepID=A0A1Y5T9K0_9RHOB|nr:Transcriptional regulator SlyA [Pseudoruegeria aquimaris]